MNKYKVIGLMSGTSMDGVDLAYCEFTKSTSGWQVELKQTHCVAYSDQWLSRLVHLPEQSAEIFAKAHVYYGKYLGQMVKKFIEEYELQPDLIASHGQTVFHAPKQGYTVQIGHGAEIAASTGITTVCDLRTTDVALGGQGAPIVPLGEKELFPDYNCFINIGGITNISFHQADQVIAYDVCMGNILLDYFAEEMNLPFDDGGKLAKSGSIIPSLLDRLNQNQYVKQDPPKSLHAADVVSETLQLLQDDDVIPDVLRTLVEHISHQIATTLDANNTAEVMITGGGAFNSFLIEKIKSKTKAAIVIPEQQIIEYKEALIIAFLGLQRILKKPNVLSSVTGASRDSINGAVYL